MSAWDNLCIKGITWVIGQLPGVIKNGYSAGGVTIPALTNIPIPSQDGIDTGSPLESVCGTGATATGDCTVSFDSLTLSGLETIALVSGQSPSFDQNNNLNIPLTFGGLSIAGNYSATQKCSIPSGPYKLTGAGTFTAALTLPTDGITLSAGQLSIASGPVGSVQVTWPSSGGAYEGKFKVQAGQSTFTPNPLPAGAPQPNSFAIPDALELGLPKKVLPALANYITGSSFTGTIQSYVNTYFQKYLQQLLIAGWKALFDTSSSDSLPKQIPDPWSFSNIPNDPSTLGADGFDLGESVPDLMGEITLGSIPVGDAEGFLSSATITGLSGLAPLVDPTHADQYGLTVVTKTAAGIPTSLMASLTIPSITVTGNWAIQQQEMILDSSSTSPGMGGGCAAQHMMRAARAGVEPSAEDMNLLRDLRTDLQNSGGAMGQWYIDQFNAYQSDLIALMQNSDWLAAVQQYGGDQLWGDILTAISNSQNGKPFTLSDDDLQNALALVSSAQQITSNISGDSGVFNAINTIVNDYLPDYDVSGLTYDQLLTIVAGETPPPSGTSATAGTAEKVNMRVAAPAPTSILDPPSTPSIYGSWSGDLSATVSNGSGTIVVSIDWGDTGAPPTFTCSGLTITVPAFNASYSGSDFASKCLVFLQKTFDPSATSGLNTEIQNAINTPGGSQTDLLKTASTKLTNLVAGYWNNPPSF